MLKISRPILYSALLGVVAYAGVVLTEADAPAKKTTKATKKAASKLDSGITAADLKAHFTRYAGKQRDAFLPKVVPARGATDEDKTLAANKALNSSLDHWNLTGISVIDGVRSATFENTTTQEVSFVKAGDRWNNMHIISVETEAVVLVNKLNQQTRLTFTAMPHNNETPNASSAPNGGGSLINTAPVVPANRGINTATLPNTPERNGNTQ